MLDAQEETNSKQDTKGKQRKEEDMNTISEKKHGNGGKNIVRTRCGRIVKKKQTGSGMNANTKTFTWLTCWTLCKS